MGATRKQVAHMLSPKESHNIRVALDNLEEAAVRELEDNDEVPEWLLVSIEKLKQVLE